MKIYGDGMQERDGCSWRLLQRDRYGAGESHPGFCYNVSSASYLPENRSATILRFLGKSDTLIQSVRDRPGHDLATR